MLPLNHTKCGRATKSGRLTLDVVKHSDKGFVVQAKRWIVERTFGWLNRERRLSKDYERKEQSSYAFIHLGMRRLMLRRLD